MTDWERIFRKYELEKQTRFGVNFIRADWDSEKQYYSIRFEHAADRSKTFTFEAEVLVSAIGGFSTPIDIPHGMSGIERFQGPRFHSSG